jgi:hypothetical protein
MIEFAIAQLKPRLNFAQGSTPAENTVKHRNQMILKQQLLAVVIGFVFGSGFANNTFVYQRKYLS